MPQVILSAEVRQALATMTARHRKAALDLFMDLAAHGPTDGEPFGNIPHAYRLTRPDVIAYVRVVGDEVDVLRVRPNS